ncbi:hypothetical protein Trydic_g18155 [Trypoxylus dichotomus]
MKTLFVLFSLVVITYSYVCQKCEPSQCHNATCCPPNNVIRPGNSCDHCCLVCMLVAKLGQRCNFPTPFRGPPPRIVCEPGTQCGLNGTCQSIS